MGDLIEDGLREVAEDRRIAGIARQQHTKDTLHRRAAVTEELVGEVEALRRDRTTALATLQDVASGMTDDAYDALLSALKP